MSDGERVARSHERHRARSGPPLRLDADTERRLLQHTLATLAVTPAASGLAGVCLGPQALPGHERGSAATLDGQYRFTSVFWLAVAPLAWSQLPRVEESATTLPLVMATVFAGGIARLLAWRHSGRPARGVHSRDRTRAGRDADPGGLASTSGAPSRGLMTDC
jgi:Domain of unknown function (DUF4345)